MHSPARTSIAALTLLAALAGSTSSARAQAAYSEGFDDLGATNWSTMGPQVLVNRGWVFRNQSAPMGSRAYFSGILPSTNPIYFGPQSGARYLAVDQGSTGQTGGEISSWAILPPIPNQISGDAVTVWARKFDHVSPLEIRYSPTGGTNTGSGPTGVGDFTQVLLTIDPSHGGWTRYITAAPGAGRLALRLKMSFEFGTGSAYVGMDSLSVGPPPPPPCNLPPIPQPGQTVTWTAANSPYRICQDISIPVGGTVNIQPGVTIAMDAGRNLVVAGVVQGTGTAGAPIVLGSGASQSAISISGGTLNVQFAQIHTLLLPLSASQLLLTDCTFPADGQLSGDGGSIPGYVRLERCSFTSSRCIMNDIVVQLRACTFTDTLAQFIRGYVDTTGGVTAIGKPFVISREEHQQPLLVDNVAASGVFEPYSNIAGPAGLALHGGDYLLGPGVTPQGNAYPIDLDGGLLPGSSVPALGNTNNAVYLSGAGGLSRLGSISIPYTLAATAYGQGARTTIDPGVRITGLPSGWMVAVSTGWLRAMGLPGSPITFEGVNGGSWQGLSFQHTGESPHLEDCIIRGAVVGAQAVDTPALTIDNCFFQNNSTGVNANTSASIFLGKTRFAGNSTGASATSGLNLFHPANPNSFEGNTAAVDAFNFQGSYQARNVWWNSPSGPQAPQNPSGTGDPIVGAGASGVSVFPFLTSPPNFADHPPVVRMQAPGRNWWRVYVTPDFVFEPGQKYIVSWSASDDAGITSQRILLNRDGGYPTGFQVLADNIPPTARSWEITIPDVGAAIASGQQFLRIVATDTAGQEGFDQTACMISSGAITGNVAITSTPPAQTLTGGMEPAPAVTYSGTASGGLASADIYLESDGQYDQGELGLLPFVSTDTARMVVSFSANGNAVKYVLGDGYFTIRPDPRLGILPPQVEVTTPAASATYSGTVPIAWTASAPEGLYAFDIQYALDGGRYWRLLAEDLPAATRAHAWVLPPNVTLNPDTAIRVIARDRRGQNSSSGADRAFTIAPGAAFCYANCDGSTGTPVLNVNDFVCFQNAFAAAEPYADCDHSGALNVNDFICFQGRFAAGCP